MRAVNAVTTSWAGLHVDRPSFSAVAESELDAVHRYLLFLTGNRAVAEDLTGETFERAFRRWRRFDPSLLSAVDSGFGDVGSRFHALQDLDFVQRDPQSGDFVWFSLVPSSMGLFRSVPRCTLAVVL